MKPEDKKIPEGHQPGPMTLCKACVEEKARLVYTTSEAEQTILPLTISFKKRA